MFDWINGKIVESAVRNLAQWVGGILLTNGWITEEQNTLVIGAAMSLAALAWSFLSAQRAKKDAIVKRAVDAATPETKADIDDVLKSIMNKPKGLAGTK